MTMKGPCRKRITPRWKLCWKTPPHKKSALAVQALPATRKRVPLTGRFSFCVTVAQSVEHPSSYPKSWVNLANRTANMLCRKDARPLTWKFLPPTQIIPFLKTPCTLRGSCSTFHPQAESSATDPWNWPKTKEKSESLSSPKLCVAPSYRSKIMLKVARGYLLSSLLLAIVKVKFVYLRDSCRAGAVTSASE